VNPVFACNSVYLDNLFGVALGGIPNREKDEY
jgi:hypothetical protein